MRHAAFPAVALLLLSGCATVGPHFQPLTPKTPAAWTNPVPPAADGSGDDSNAAREWWKTFQDPELNSLIERAVKANLDVRIAASRIVEARASQRIAESGLKPSVNTSDGATRVRGGIAQGLTRGGILSGSPQSRSNILAPYETSVYQLGFDASWELDFVGGVRRAVEAARFNVRSAGEARNDTLVTVLGDVGRTYMELRGAQKRLAVVDSNVQIQEQLVALTMAQAKAGLAPELDAIRASAQLRDTEAARFPLQDAVSQSIRRLNLLIGETPDALEAELVPPAALPPVPASIPIGLPSELLTRRSDIRRAEAEVAAQTARVGVARSDLFPKITLTGLAGRQASEIPGFTLGAGNYFSVGPGVRLPIFTAGRVRSNIRVQDSRLEQSKLQYENIVLKAFQEVEDALSCFGRTNERRIKLSEALKENDAAVALTTELYAKGLGDFLSVLDARRAKLATEDDLAQANTNISIQAVALYKALGGGW